MDRKRLRKRVVSVTIMFFTLILFGTLGYMALEGWSAWDAAYMTVITISTVGYSEVQPLSRAGEMFSVVVIVLGVGAAAYTFSVVTDYVIAGELQEAWRRQRMSRTIHKYQDHYVIGGYGRVGQQVTEELHANDFPIVVIDSNPALATELDHKGIAYVIGDATDDRMLIEAGIERASGLCSCLPSDAANVFAILSARTLNPSLYIIARGNQPESEQKMRIAGANHVINPYTITGHRMVAQLLHPGAVEFLEVIMRHGNLELRIEEIIIGADSVMARQTLGEAKIRSATGVNVLAVRRSDGSLFTQLDPELTLTAGDALVCLGTAEQLRALAERAADRRKWLK